MNDVSSRSHAIFTIRFSQVRWKNAFTVEMCNMLLYMQYLYHCCGATDLGAIWYYGRSYML